MDKNQGVAGVYVVGASPSLSCSCDHRRGGGGGGGSASASVVAGVFTVLLW